MAAGERIFEVLDVQPEVKDAPDAYVMPPVVGKVDFMGVQYYGSQPMVGFGIALRPSRRIGGLPVGVAERRDVDRVLDVVESPRQHTLEGDREREERVRDTDVAPVHQQGTVVADEDLARAISLLRSTGALSDTTRSRVGRRSPRPTSHQASNSGSSRAARAMSTVHRSDVPDTSVLTACASRRVRDSASARSLAARP